MPKRIPVKVARDVAKLVGARQVILLAWDGKFTHIVTYGKTVEDCAQVAEGGNMLKKKWGWPESNDQPSRVKKLISLLRRYQESARDHSECGNGREPCDLCKETDALIEGRTN